MEKQAKDMSVAELCEAVERLPKAPDGLIMRIARQTYSEKTLKQRHPTFEHTYQLLDAAVEKLLAKIAKLEKQIEELQEQPTLRYLGLFEPGRVYEAGSFVTDHGSVWYAEATTSMRPGSSDKWTPAVKRGRDAR